MLRRVLSAFVAAAFVGIGAFAAGASADSLVYLTKTPRDRRRLGTSRGRTAKVQLRTAERDCESSPSGRGPRRNCQGSPSDPTAGGPRVRTKVTSMHRAGDRWNVGPRGAAQSDADP